MPSPLPSVRQRARNQYCLGLASIFLGAYLMDRFGSVLPMAMGASAGLMLSVPLLRELGLRFLGRKDPGDAA
ncbi:MAG: hypothetical protein EOP38_10255 [Rubrivivax sp.]|nr:MAG: hypothetical protein EOP38_10255 [Rubrivivax sp.]